MRGFEVLLGRKESEISILRECVERVSQVLCNRVSSGETIMPPHGCGCFSCQARECLETIKVIEEIYNPETYDA